MDDRFWGAAPRFGRRTTILRALQRLAATKSTAPVIVETGTIRAVDGLETDGWSTVAWAWFAAARGGRATTIDVSPEALAVCRRATTPWHESVAYVKGEAVDVLAAWSVKDHGLIDLLYLDSLDFEDETQSELQCLHEAEAAFAKLAPQGMVLIDDVRPIGPPSGTDLPRFSGKGALAIPWLASQGFRLIWAFDGQALLSRDALVGISAASAHLHRNRELLSADLIRLRIMISSNAPWTPTGYGAQVRLIVARLRALGHEVALHCNFGLDGGSIGWEGVTLYPRGEQHPFGHDILSAHAAHFRADLVIFLGDAWVIDHDLLEGGPPLVPWFPVDSDPIPPQVADRVRRAWRSMSFSRFGVRQAAEVGIESDYVPLAVDLNEFRPRDRRDARARLGLPLDAYIVGMVAANKDFPSRKAFPQVFAAFAEFRRRHRDALLYVHTQSWTRRMGGGTDLGALAKDLGIDRAVRIADPYAVAMGLSTLQMSELYSTFDVLASPSLGEGFGVPIIEAQACGCPVIVGDWTSMPERCFSGAKIAFRDAEPFWTPLHAWQFVPRVGALVEAMELVRAQAGRPGFDAETARRGAESYDIDVVVREHWAPTLERLAHALRTRSER